MAKQYFLTFGSGAPSTHAGLSPTMSVCKTAGGSNVIAPAITEVPSSTGIYTFAYGPTSGVAFVVDGFTTGLADSIRYIVGNLDPIQAVDEFIGSTLYPMGVTLTAIGSSISVQGVTLTAIGASIGVQGVSITAQGVSLTAIGATLTWLAGSSFLGASLAGIAASIGTTASSFGSTSVDPGTLYGYLKRLQEFNEGNSTFNKSTSLWDIYSRGSSTLLAEKSLDDSSGQVVKS